MTEPKRHVPFRKVIAYVPDGTAHVTEVLECGHEVYSSLATKKIKRRCFLCAQPEVRH